jgi:Alpha amylase, catalytic domain
LHLRQRSETHCECTRSEHMPVEQIPWWQRATIYQVYPRSFQDTDGDGVGDLRGIISRLPYFAELGVDAIWLSPIFRSPMKDFGYDVSNYVDIDPLFGTMGDFDTLLEAAHKQGLRLLLDFVPNSIHGSCKADPRGGTPSATGIFGATQRPMAGRPTTGYQNSAEALGNSIMRRVNIIITLFFPSSLI